MGALRYPGALPFNKKQENIFFGRGKDIENLQTLIEVEPHVLFYSKSGLGKTSLIEAGVIPKLPSNYISLSIRFYIYTEKKKDSEEEKEVSPVERVIEVLKTKIENFEELSDTLVDQLIEHHKRHKSLWYYFKKLELAEKISFPDQQERIYVLFFDQFEELFSYPEEQIQEFINQFYDLTRLDVPANIARLIAIKRRNQKELFNTVTIPSLHKQKETKSVFVIRSDRLSLLNKLSDKITDIQKTYYEINPLDDQDARNAIIKPALDEDKSFETLPFKYEDEAIEKIIWELSKEGTQFIETTQLQIVCQRLEEIAKKKQEDIAQKKQEEIAEKKQLPPSSQKPVVIKVGDLPKFSNIFLNFYNDSINKIPEEKEKLGAKRLIEDQLIRNQQRISLDENICKEYVLKTTLDILVNTHLLRAERNSFKRFSYELSHDTLVQPILDSKIKFKEEQKLNEEQELKDKKAQEKREKEEQIKKIKEQRVFKKRVFIALTIFITISAVAMGMWYKSYINEKKATEYANEATRQQEIAEKATDSLRIAQYYLSFKEGQDYMKNEEYEKAGEKFEYAQKIRNVDTLDALIKNCSKLNELKAEYEDIKVEANNYYLKKNFIKSMKAYDEALKTGYNYTEITLAKEALRQEALKFYKKDLQDYIELEDQEMINLTNRRIQQMQNL